MLTTIRYESYLDEKQVMNILRRYSDKKRESDKITSVSI